MITKYNIGITLILSLSIVGGILNSHIINDGYHWGFIYSNSTDFLYGKKPYEDIFLEYGFLQNLINVFLIKIFGDKIIIIQYFIILIYASSLFFIYLIIQQITNNIKISFFSILLIFILYPWPTVPWPTFISFFFSILFIFFYLKNKIIYSYLSGFALFFAYLSYTTLFNIIIFFYIIYLIFIFSLTKYLNYKSNHKFNINFFITFIFLLSIFIYYLIINNIFLEWLSFQKIPFIVKENFNYSYITLIKDYFYFLFIYPILNIIYEPQWVFYSFFFISNIFCFFCFFQKKSNEYKKLNLKLLNIFIFIFLLNILGQTKTLLYFSCSISLAIICFAYLFDTLNKKDNKFIISSLLVLLSIYCVFNYNMHYSKHAQSRSGSLKNLYNNNLISSNNIEYFKNFKWDKNYFDFLFKVEKKINSINKNCNKIAGVNLTHDTFLYLLLKKNTIQKIPFYLTGSKYQFNEIFDPFLFSKVQNYIDNNNIIILSHKNSEKQLNFNKNYSFTKLKRITTKIIDDEYIIFYPKKCD